MGKNFSIRPSHLLKLAFAFIILVAATVPETIAADMPLAASSPLAGFTFEDKPLSLPVQRNFQMAMLTASSELGRSCGKMEAYGWRMNQSEQARVNQIFNTTVDSLRGLGYSVEAQSPASVSRDITMFTADRSDNHFLLMWSAGEIGLVMVLCQTSSPMPATVATHAPVDVFPPPREVMQSSLAPLPDKKHQLAAARFSPVGTWYGNYTCGQGYTGATLEITGLHGENFDGTFRFYPTPKNPSIPSGRYTVYGQYDRDSNRILINPGKWLERPKNFYNTVMVGSFDPIERTFSAYFQGITGCTSFEAKNSADAYTGMGGKVHKTVKKKKPKKKIVKKPIEQTTVPALETPATATAPAATPAPVDATSSAPPATPAAAMPAGIQIPAPTITTPSAPVEASPAAPATAAPVAITPAAPAATSPAPAAASPAPAAATPAPAAVTPAPATMPAPAAPPAPATTPAPASPPAAAAPPAPAAVPAAPATPTGTATPAPAGTSAPKPSGAAQPDPLASPVVVAEFKPRSGSPSAPPVAPPANPGIPAADPNSAAGGSLIDKIFSKKSNPAPSEAAPAGSSAPAPGSSAPKPSGAAEPEPLSKPFMVAAVSGQYVAPYIPQAQQPSVITPTIPQAPTVPQASTGTYVTPTVVTAPTAVQTPQIATAPTPQYVSPANSQAPDIPTAPPPLTVQTPVYVSPTLQTAPPPQYVPDNGHPQGTPP